MIKRAVFLILIIFISFNVSAFAGVSPASYSVDFKSNLKQVFTFNFLNDIDSKFEVYAEGDLAKYITLDKKEIKGGGSVNVLLDLPSNIDLPGEHKIFIGARQKVEETGGVSLVANIRGVIKVIVPYPGKYAELEFQASNANINENVNFVLKINNKGKEAIQTSSYIEIYSDNNKIETLDLGTNLIESANSIELKKELSTNTYKAGNYNSVAIVNYAGEKKTKDAVFRLGQLYISIINTTDGFIKDKINRFDINIESFWNDPIENVYANVTILNSNINFITPSIRLDSWKTASLNGFIDATGLDNNFKAKVTLNYYNKTSEKTFDLKIKREYNYLMIIIVIAVIFLASILAFLIIAVLKLNKKLKNEKNK